MISVRALQTDFLGDHNIGLFARSSDRFCVAGHHLTEKRVSELEKVLGVDVVQLSVANSEIVGIFCAMNSNGIVVPHIATSSEVKFFRSLAEERGISFGMLKSNFTALGNLILCNDKGAVVSELFTEKEKKNISNFLGVDAEYGSVAGLKSVGSCGIATNRGCVLHRDASEDELNNFQKTLGVDTDVGTANFGSPFLGSCAIANSNGLVAGGSTTGPEITRMMETLELL